MDLLEILRRDIEQVPEGEHTLGLRSVLRHISAAEAHLTRGQETKDDSAFTDAIYRSNQAFEGSVKEAYRVLTGKDPDKLTIFSIENYLQRNKILRDRVLSLLKNYRTEWRNPSTHDYNLDFDENEALLAIVSVAAFAKLLIDQIAQRLAFVAVQVELEAEPPPAIERQGGSLGEKVVAHLKDFIQLYGTSWAGRGFGNESQMMGALAGFFDSVAPDLDVSMEYAIKGVGRPRRVDFYISHGGRSVVLEIKRDFRRVLLEQGLQQIESYVSATGAQEAVLMFIGDTEEKYTSTRQELPGVPDGVIILAPSKALRGE